MMLSPTICFLASFHRVHEAQDRSLLIFLIRTAQVFDVADAAAASAAGDMLFTDLTTSWLYGVSLNMLVQTAGIDTLSTVFSDMFQDQLLVFSWSDSVAGVGFGFDVETRISEVPIPAALPLFISALLELGLASRGRRKSA